jgi:histidyl-tRNA synthetase
MMAAQEIEVERVAGALGAVITGMDLSSAPSNHTVATLREALRDQHPALQIIVHAGGGSFKSQMRKADKSGASIALILGESEIASEQVAIKFLRDDREQIEMPQSDIAKQLASLIYATSD